jgi:hypothetical protein
MLVPKDLIRVREELKFSRALFAVYLRTKVRTLENRERGARPAECAGRAADQSRQALSGHRPAARIHLIEGSKDGRRYVNASRGCTG